MLVPGNSDIRTSSLHDGISPLCNSSFRLTYERSKYEHCVGEVGRGGGRESHSSALLHLYGIELYRT